MAHVSQKKFPIVNQFVLLCSNWHKYAFFNAGGISWHRLVLKDPHEYVELCLGPIFIWGLMICKAYSLLSLLLCIFYIRRWKIVAYIFDMSS